MGVRSNICLTGGFESGGTQDGFLALFAGQHTSFRLSTVTGDNRTDHKILSITPPDTPFWLELERDGLTVICRILNDDLTVRHELTQTFATAVPSGGTTWGFGFYQDGSIGSFDNFYAFQKVVAVETLPTFDPAGFDPNAFDAGQGTIVVVRLKYWDGTQWKSGTLRYWNGSSWVPKTLKYWDGASWLS